MDFEQCSRGIGIGDAYCIDINSTVRRIEADGGGIARVVVGLSGYIGQGRDGCCDIIERASGDVECPFGGGTAGDEIDIDGAIAFDREEELSVVGIARAGQFEAMGEGDIVEGLGTCFHFHCSLGGSQQVQFAYDGLCGERTQAIEVGVGEVPEGADGDSIGSGGFVGFGLDRVRVDRVGGYTSAVARRGDDTCRGDSECGTCTTGGVGDSGHGIGGREGREGIGRCAYGAVSDIGGYAL